MNDFRVRSPDYRPYPGMRDLQVAEGEEAHYVASRSSGFIVKDLKGKAAPPKGSIR